MLGSLVIKSCGAFLEAPAGWICPACGRSKTQIVATGQNVDVVARIVMHHDHIEDLIAQAVYRGPVATPAERQRQSELRAELERVFCRFQATEICEACNNADATAKSIVRAPRWFSFSPHGIANFIQRPAEPYAAKHKIDLPRLRVIWDKVSTQIYGLEHRIARALDEADISTQRRA